MSISSQDALKGFYTAKNAIGAPSINSDATFEIEGHEDLVLNTKQFPWPVIGTFGEIEVVTPMGGMYYKPQQLKTAQQGPITFTETVTGRIMRFMEEILRTGGEFNATVYEGTPDRFVRAYKLKGCFFQPDQPDRDWENRAQITLINGTLFYNFFGDQLAPNATSL